MKVKKERSRASLKGVVRGVLVSLSPDGEPNVDFVGNPSAEPIPSLATVSVQNTHVGQEAVLMFEDGDSSRPILLGFIQDQTKTGSAHAQIEGEKLVLTGDREIVLQCGQASITLTRAGKVLIRGKYVLSRSSGVNLVQGGIVRLN